MKRLLYWAGVILSPLALLLITLFSLLPPEDSFIALTPIAHFDKILHTVSYAALSCVMLWMLSNDKKSNYKKEIIIVWLLCSTIGATIELIQPLFGRSKEVADLLFNVLGSTIGLMVSHAILKLVHRRTTGGDNNGSLL